MTRNTDLYNAYSAALERGSGQTGKNSSSSIQGLLRQMLNEQDAALERARRQAEKQLKEQERQALQGEYILSQRQHEALPQQLAGYGSGGVSETAAIALNANYNNNRNSINRQALETQANLNNQYDNQKSANMANYYSALSDYRNALEQRRYEQQRYDEEMQFKRENEEFDRELAKEKFLFQQQQANSKKYVGSAKANTTKKEGATYGVIDDKKLKELEKQKQAQLEQEQSYKVNNYYRLLKGYYDNYLSANQFPSGVDKELLIDEQLSRLTKDGKISMEVADKIYQKFFK